MPLLAHGSDAQDLHRELEQERDSDDERPPVVVDDSSSDGEEEDDGEEEEKNPRQAEQDGPDKQDAGGISSRLSSSLNISGQK